MKLCEGDKAKAKEAWAGINGDAVQWNKDPAAEVAAAVRDVDQRGPEPVNDERRREAIVLLRLALEAVYDGAGDDEAAAVLDQLEDLGATIEVP